MLERIFRPSQFLTRNIISKLRAIESKLSPYVF